MSKKRNRNNKTVAVPEESTLDDWYGRSIYSSNNFRDGRINDYEFIKELTGPNRLYCYQEMGKNDPLSSAALKMIQLLIRAVEWTAIPAEGRGAEADDWAEFLTQARDDMQMPWRSFLVQASSMITFGFSVHEIGFKIRAGSGRGNPFFCSSYDDGKIGWMALPQRSQFSVSGWDQDKRTGILNGIYQEVDDREDVYIPANRLLHFRTSADLNPEGESWMRGGYVSYCRQRRYEAWRDIAVKRDMAGTPVVYMPNAAMKNETKRAQYAAMVQGIHRGERAGLILPAKYESVQGGDRRTGWDFELIKSSGNGNYDIGQTIQSFWQERAMSMLTQVQMLGVKGTGSHAQSEDQSNMLKEAIEALLKEMADVFHTQATIPLMRLNGVPADLMPRLRPRPLKQQSIDAFARAISEMANAGVMAVTRDVVNVAHNKIGVPAVTQSEFDEFQARAEAAANPPPPAENTEEVEVSRNNTD